MEIYSRLCNLASLHVAYIFLPPIPRPIPPKRLQKTALAAKEQKSRFFLERKKKPTYRLLKDERRTEYSWWLISRMVAD